MSSSADRREAGRSWKVGVPGLSRESDFAWQCLHLESSLAAVYFPLTIGGNGNICRFSSLPARIRGQFVS